MYRGEVAILAGVQWRFAVDLHFVSAHVVLMFELLRANVALKIVMITVS